MHRPFIDLFIDPSSTSSSIHASTPSSILHPSLHRPFIDPFIDPFIELCIDPSSIPSSTLHRPLHQSMHRLLHRSFIDPSSIPSSTLHRPLHRPLQTTQDHSKITPRPPQDHPSEKCCFFIKNDDFSLEKCRFGAQKVILHYVLKRKLSFLEKKSEKVLEKCVIQRRGRAAPLVGSVPVAHLLASEARQPPPTGPHSGAYSDPSLCLFPARMERVLRDLATPSNKKLCGSSD